MSRWRILSLFQPDKLSVHAAIESLWFPMHRARRDVMLQESSEVYDIPFQLHDI
jgi:hypothetical protein